MLMLGTLMGGLVGAVIWILGIIRGKSFGVGMRALIGFTVAVIVMVLAALTFTPKPGLDHPPKSWMIQAVEWVMSCVIIGVLPAMMARQKSAALKPASSSGNR